MSRPANEIRKSDVGCTAIGRAVVSTIECTDKVPPFETAIGREGDPDWTIVERYSSRADAQAGHEKWCARERAADSRNRKAKEISP